MNEEDKILKLLEQMKNGDERAFAEFYSQTYKYVYSRAKCMFSDEEEVQDLVQEVYLALYRNAANIQSSESIFGWLKTTTFYQGTKMLKKKRKEVLLSEDGEEMFESIPDDEPEIEEGYMNQEDVQVIRDCINRLSDEQKTVLLAYYYDNLKVNEIAEILSLSAGTIKSRLYLARKNLQVHIEEEEKKRGYKLHSFGAVTLALALRMFLQGNMEVAGSVEETIFAKVCQGLNFEVSKAVAAQSGLAEQVVQEGTKQAGKGILGKLGALGAKKIAITVVGILAAATVVTGTLINMRDKEEESHSEEFVPWTVGDIAELQQWQKDYAKILFEILYMTEEVEEIFMEDPAFYEDWGFNINEPNAMLSYALCSNFEFSLYDISGDNVPELFVSTRHFPSSSDEKYLFTLGNDAVESYVGCVNYVYLETRELICIDTPKEDECTNYVFNGTELVKKSVNKIDADTLHELYLLEERMPLESYQLTLENILEQLQISIRERDKALLERIFSHYYEDGTGEVARIYFNEDEEIDYIFFRDNMEFDLMVAKGDDLYVTSIDIDENERRSYVEKAGKIIYHFGDNIHETVYSREYVEEELKDGVRLRKGYHQDDFGNIDSTPYFWCEINNDLQELTESEFMQMYQELCRNEVDIINDLERVEIRELLSDIKITLKN